MYSKYASNMGRIRVLFWTWGGDSLHHATEQQLTKAKRIVGMTLVNYTNK